MFGGCETRVIADEAIDAYSFVRISGWDDTNKAVKIAKPNAENMAYYDLLFVYNSIASGKIGVGYYGGFGIIKIESGESLVAGDKCGTKLDAFTAIEIDDDSEGYNDGQFKVIAPITIGGSDYAIVRARTKELVFAFP